MSAIVSVNKLTKSYGKFTAVHQVSFEWEANRIYGLLGRNGAGKTTLMHMLTAQLFPTSGEIRVFGENPYENNRVLSQLCFIKESQKYPDNYRVVDALAVAGHFFPNWDQDYAMSLVEDFRLPLKRRMKKLSRGMLSAVGIVIGLASRAPLTIFDEPYIGLDAVARNLFYDRLVKDYSEHPRTIVLSTHLIDEVSSLLEHVLLIDRGRLLLDEEADALRGRAYTVAGKSVRVSEFASGRQVIHRDTFGPLATAAIMGELDAATRDMADSMGLEIAPVSLQQLIVYMTGGKEADQGVNLQ